MMNIVLAINQNFVFAAKICISSILKHNKAVAIYLLYSSVEEQSLEEIGELISKLDSEGKYIPIKMDGSIFDGMPTSETITKETYFRLLLPRVLPNEDRVLYLDADTIIRKPIDKLYNLDMGENYAAAVEDWGLRNQPHLREEIFTKLGFDKEDVYFNAGVWLFNLVRIRQDFADDALITFLRHNVSRITFHDQCVLNACFHGRIQSVDFQYNFRPHLFWSMAESYILRKAYIIHYGAKPWNGDFCDICGDAFWDIAAEAGYKKEYEEYKSSRIKNRVRMYCHEIERWKNRNPKMNLQRQLKQL